MKIVPRETDISSSLAAITGPTAAIALPPQIAVPDEIRCEVVRFTRIARPIRNPARRVPAIVTTVNAMPVSPAAITF